MTYRLRDWHRTCDTVKDGLPCKGFKECMVIVMKSGPTQFMGLCDICKKGLLLVHAKPLLAPRPQPEPFSEALAAVVKGFMKSEIDPNVSGIDTKSEEYD